LNVWEELLQQKAIKNNHFEILSKIVKGTSAQKRDRKLNISLFRYKVVQILSETIEKEFKQKVVLGERLKKFYGSLL
jgi:hypothetical protein